MPVIPKPTSFERDPLKDEDRLKTRLFFEEGSADFYLRGAIAWPKRVPQGQGYEDIYYPGFILMAGQNLTDPNHPIWIFKCQEFKTIANLMTEDRTTVRNNPSGGYWYGLAYFVNHAYTDYGCRSYFYGGQPEEIYQSYQQKMTKRRKEKILEIPIIPIKIGIENIGDHLISEYVEMGKWKADDNTRLSELLKSFDVSENNGAHAVKCLFAGYEKNPWHDLRMMRHG